MTTIATALRSDTTTVAPQPQAANGLAIVRLTIGTMFLWVFFENLGKGLYTPAGYAGLINYFIKASHSPAAWKAVMSWSMGCSSRWCGKVPLSRSWRDRRGSSREVTVIRKKFSRRARMFATVRVTSPVVRFVHD